MTSVVDCELEDLRCSESGHWTLTSPAGTHALDETPPSPASDSTPILPPGANRSRFPQNAPFREPPKHYLASPAPYAPPPAYDSYARHLKAMMSELHSTSPRQDRRSSPVPHTSNFRLARESPSALPGQTTTLSSGSVQVHSAPSPALTSRGDSADEGCGSSPTSSSPGSPSGRGSHSKSPAPAATSPFSKIPRRRASQHSPQLAKSTPYVPPNMRDLAPKMETDGSDPKSNLQYTVTVCKRSNGNQPWEASNVRPPMLGKMRRMTVQFAPFEGLAFEVLFQCKDLKPDLHEGRLVVSANDKGIARNASTLPSLDESLFRTVVQPNEQSSQAISVYLKPCWRGFGSNRERPVFSVTVAVRPAERECAFVILHSWNVELHSHKMESSTKGKAMDANGPFEVRGTIPLHILQQPFIAGGTGPPGDGTEEQIETCAMGSVPPPPLPVPVHPHDEHNPFTIVSPPPPLPE